MNEPKMQPSEPTPAEAEQNLPQTQQQPAETDSPDDGILTVSADELQLPTPVLEEPTISEDVAAEVALSEVEAETRAVQQQAEKAGTLAGGPSVKPGSGKDSDKEDVQHKIEAAASKARAKVIDERES
ncbi:hypothetical protein [Arthrobacter pigmenti]